MPQKYVIADTGKYGRGLFAAVDLTPGEVIEVRSHISHRIVIVPRPSPH